VALNITQIVIAVAVTGFTIATSVLSCKALCCQNKTQGSLLNQPGLYYFLSIFYRLFAAVYTLLTTICLPFVNHLLTICLSFAYHLFTVCLPFGYHLLTIFLFYSINSE
jgi:hypothetical protein